MYGPIPIMKQNLPIAVSTGEVRSVRQPVDSVFNYIVQLLDEAAASLPDRINNEVEEQGRITRPIALSVKAEVLATQASPLYNGNPDYAGFSNKDGQALFSVDYDPLKWEKTVEACKEAIDACHEAGIAFYDFIPPANITHISDTTHLTLTLRNAMTDEWNSEIIWTINKQFDYQYLFVARLNAEAITNYGIHSRFAVPLGQAELYYTDNGVPIAEDKTWDYKNRYNLQQSDSAYRYYIKEGYQTVKLHFDREPRFYASVGFDGGLWFGNGTLNDNNSLYVQAKAGQPAGDAGQGRTNVTGYFPKKLVHYQSVFLTNSTTFGYYWPMMRLPGLYLLYAEALNELNGPSETVYQSIDMVRARAGLKRSEEQKS